MNYDRLQPSQPGGSSRRSDDAIPPSASPRSKKKLIFLSALALVLIVASALSAVLLVRTRPRSTPPHDSGVGGKPTQAISRTCDKTLFPSLCVQSLLEFPGSAAASEQDLVHISLNMTLQHLSKALYSSTAISAVQMDPLERSAYEDCLELLEDSVDGLLRSLTSGATAGGSTDDVLTWLSAALTNIDTCSEGFADTSGTVKYQMASNLKDLSELISNCLAIYAGSDAGNDFSGVPIQNRRRLMGENDNGDVSGEFPAWLSKRDRRLLATPASAIQADIVVSKDGSGTVKTITEAIKKVPEHSSRRIVVYVKAGSYEEENLKVGKKKTNVMFVGDGKGKTIITGGRNYAEGTTTFHTASFAASGAGFIAKDMTFENYAGPGKHQAVALRVGADHAVVYRCSIVGYQDTCYVHSNRQFFRECDIYGTIDFIFGNAAVVFQSCNLVSRKPMDQQKNTITAQNRKDPNQNTGISIHNCRIKRLRIWRHPRKLPNLSGPSVEDVR
ncbi:hypothetical protein K1719_044783 [Acacia pycnantha]|nr:hypothetical protein K1719_044783 [Acacia pycnantha]